MTNKIKLESTLLSVVQSNKCALLTSMYVFIYWDKRIIQTDDEPQAIAILDSQFESIASVYKKVDSPTCGSGYQLMWLNEEQLI